MRQMDCLFGYTARSPDPLVPVHPRFVGQSLTLCQCSAMRRTFLSGFCKSRDWPLSRRMPPWSCSCPLYVMLIDASTTNCCHMASPARSNRERIRTRKHRRSRSQLLRESKGRKGVLCSEERMHFYFHFYLVLPGLLNHAQHLFHHIRLHRMIAPLYFSFATILLYKLLDNMYKNPTVQCES